MSGIYFLLFLHSVQKRKQSWTFICSNNLLSVSLCVFLTKLEFLVVFKEASQSDSFHSQKVPVVLKMKNEMYWIFKM